MGGRGRRFMGPQGIQVIVRCAAILAVLWVLAPVPAAFPQRVRDLAMFEGVRENQLTGYGLVVGLDGTGDKGTATQRSIANMLQRMGLSVQPGDIKAKNTAAVAVTAKLPPFPKPGTRVDVVVSTLGDAKNLQGGTLLLTPLKGADGMVYALAQGSVSIGGFVGGGGGTKVQKNHPTAGTVPQGAIVEREPKFSLAGADGRVRLFLHDPDFTNATRIASKINETVSPDCASAADSSTVWIKVPEEYHERVPELLARVEGIDVPVDIPARVTVNERTGTVIVGENVRISPVAIAHGNLTIEVRTEVQVSQPPPFAPDRSETVVVPKKEVTADEPKASLVEVSGTTLGEIVRALNTLGVTPRDLIAILQALRSSGALRAELEIL